ILNNQPMGFYPPAVLVGDAKRHGVAVLPVDVNRSRADCIVEWAMGRAPDSPTPSRSGATGSNPQPPPAAVRLGFKYVRGLGEAACAQRFVGAAQHPPAPTPGPERGLRSADEP